MADEKLSKLVKDLNEYLGKRHPVFKDKPLVYRCVYHSKEKVNENRILFEGNILYSCEGQVDWEILLAELQKETAIRTALLEMVSAFFKHTNEKDLKEKYGIER